MRPIAFNYFRLNELAEFNGLENAYETDWYLDLFYLLGDAGNVHYSDHIGRWSEWKQICNTFQ